MPLVTSFSALDLFGNILFCMSDVQRRLVMLCARKFVKVSEESYETVNKIPSALRQLHGIEVEKDGL